MFEVECLWNGWVKKDGSNASLVLTDWPNFRYHIDFAFSPSLKLKYGKWRSFYIDPKI